MLQKKAVDPATLELIKSLQQKDYLKEFALVGGTALALYLGHRKSVDIDLFSEQAFDTGKMLESVQQDYHMEVITTAKNTLKGTIDGVNVDILTHSYPLLQKYVLIDGIRLYDSKDILAMKLNAISVSGQRSKDFIDVYYVLKNGMFTISDLIEFYKTKYTQKDSMHVVKSLSWFEDVDLADWPVLLKEQDLKWDTVTNYIRKEIKRVF